MLRSEIANVAAACEITERALAMSTKLVTVHADDGDRTVLLYQRASDDQLKGADALQPERPGNVQFNIASATQFLIGLKADAVGIEVPGAP